MSKALWGHALLYAAALSAGACAHGGQRTETSLSYRGGQAAQPHSWISEAPADPAARSKLALSHEPAGQAAQQYSWIGESQSEVPAPAGLAQDGPTYLGGRAAQPQSWVSNTPAQSESDSLASAHAGSRSQ